MWEQTLPPSSLFIGPYKGSIPQESAPLRDNRLKILKRGKIPFSGPVSYTHLRAHETGAYL
eukprot:6990424-Pyramimonas_sp.AAC.1